MRLVVHVFRVGALASYLREEAAGFETGERKGLPPRAHVAVEIPEEAPVEVQAELVNATEIAHLTFFRQGAIVADFGCAVNKHHHAILVLPSGFRVAASVERRRPHASPAAHPPPQSQSG